MQNCVLLCFYALIWYSVTVDMLVVVVVVVVVLVVVVLISLVLVCRSGQYTVKLTASNAVSSKIVTVDVFVHQSICKPPDIALLPSDHLHSVRLLHKCQQQTYLLFISGLRTP